MPELKKTTTVDRFAKSVQPLLDGYLKSFGTTQYGAAVKVADEIMPLYGPLIEASPLVVRATSGPEGLPAHYFVRPFTAVLSYTTSSGSHSSILLPWPLDSPSRHLIEHADAFESALDILTHQDFSSSG